MIHKYWWLFFPSKEKKIRQFFRRVTVAWGHQNDVTYPRVYFVTQHHSEIKKNGSWLLCTIFIKFRRIFKDIYELFQKFLIHQLIY